MWADIGLDRPRLPYPWGKGGLSGGEVGGSGGFSMGWLLGEGVELIDPCGDRETDRLDWSPSWSPWRVRLDPETLRRDKCFELIGGRVGGVVADGDRLVPRPTA